MDELDLGATIRGFSAGQKLFTRYTLIKQLGRGGMGVVWRARDESLERDVAIKMLPEMVANDPAAVRELKRETARNQQLSHPHIMRVYDFAEGAGLCGITMEIAEGGTLTLRRLDQPGEHFEPRQLRDWVRQLCEGLDHAHQRAKVVHRDLKPANLMLTADAELKITDFGIAASLSESVTRVSKQAGSSGTPVYMSPQQMMGEKPAVTDDIYALGATLYELLTGKPPFYAGNILLQVQNKTAPTIAGRRAELGLTGEPVPPEWEQTIAACLAKEPADRPQSAGEVAARLGLASSPNAQRSNEGKLSGRASRPDEPQAQSRIENRKSKIGAYFGLAASVIALAALGWYFGLHAPEQKRLADIARLESEKKTEEANRLRTEQEKAAAESKARAEEEQKAYAVIVAKIDAFVDGSPAALRAATDTAIKAYLATAPLRFRQEVETRWADRLTGWEIALQKEKERLAAERLAAARGGIAIRTNPAGAEVRVGAVALDKSPLTLKDQKLGKYPVRVRLDGYEEWSGEVEVKENEFADLDVALVRSTGTVALTSDPAGLEAEIIPLGQGFGGLGGQKTADGGQKVRTPATLKLPTGAYEFTFRRAGWPDDKQKVEVARNQTLTATADFAPGGLELTSAPAGAEVWQDGRRIEATTPYRVSEIIPDLYEFELRLKGFKPAATSVTVTARQIAREHATLEKQAFPQPGQPWENSLGQRFVPVPGIGVLFCIWETRVQDFEAFVRETGHNATQGMYSNRGDGWKQQGDSWKSPGFPQGPTHPVVGVNHADAVAFCRWLTEKERRDGLLSADQEYRLPTDSEWDAAVGNEEFPWGGQWPPPRGAGNYLDESAKRGRFKSLDIISGYDDGYDVTAPVGSFTSNRHEIFDLGGNVWERVGDRTDGVRGASFNDFINGRSRLVSVGRVPGGGRADGIGFRVVVAPGSSSR